MDRLRRARAARAAAAVLFAVLLAGAGAAWGACVCSLVPRCRSVEACTAASPGQECAPPAGGVCAITKGLPSDTVCCCTCARRSGPVARCAARYADLHESLAALPASLVLCDSAVLDRAIAAALRKAKAALVAAGRMCDRGREPKEEARLEASAVTMAKLLRFTDRLELRGRVPAGCGDLFALAVDRYVTSTRDPTTATTSTVTSTTVSTSTSTTSSTVVGPGVTLAAPLGDLLAGATVCLTRVSGACLSDAAPCPGLHLHALAEVGIAVAGVAGGPFTDPGTTGQHCGYGLVTDLPGCGSASLSECP